MASGNFGCFMHPKRALVAASSCLTGSGIPVDASVGSALVGGTDLALLALLLGALFFEDPPGAVGLTVKQ
eukprot:3509585-Heterocapsa_arctica.AAC.1